MMWKDWLTVVLGAVFEVSWVIRASQHIPAGTAYAVFVGLGTLGTTTLGMVAFGEPVSWAKIALILLLLLGIGGLQTITEKGVD